MDYNKVIISGRLVRDPEGKALPSGAPLTNFSLASNRRWVKDGEQKEETEFHNIVVFGKQGESVAKYLRKGNTALVEGRLQTRSWENEGVKHYRTEIIADRVIFGPKAVSEDRPEPEDDAPRVESTKPSQVEYPDETINPEDIPF